MAQNLSSTNSYPALYTFSITTSWETITLPSSAKQVDVYCSAESKFDYAASPSIEAIIPATTWFTVWATGATFASDKTFSMKASSGTVTVFLRILQ